MLKMLLLISLPSPSVFHPFVTLNDIFFYYDLNHSCFRYDHTISMNTLRRVAGHAAGQFGLSWQQKGSKVPRCAQFGCTDIYTIHVAYFTHFRIFFQIKFLFKGFEL